MRVALAKIAFLPFGRMIDQWRWDVFSGRITPEDYNEGWWRLREKYQGVGAPVSRSEADFDAGAKYHIPANTPYLRYFFAHILQFQLHKSLCEAAGHQGPLHTCSVYGNREAGARLQAMLRLGASRPWPDALELATGTRQMDAAPLVEYFAPLEAWLREQNQGRTCGWE
jgi:peptidyl-dipeptidase A